MQLPQFINRLSLNIKLNALLIVGFVIMGITLNTLTRVSVEALVVNFGREQLQEEATLLQQHFASNEQTIIQSTRLLAAASGLVAAVETEDVNEMRNALLLQAESLDIDNINVMNRAGENVLTIAQANAVYAEGGDQ